MSNGKLRIPTIHVGESSRVSDAVLMETLKTQRESIKANASRDVAKLDVMREAITVTKDFFAVLRSRNELDATRAEWDGRIRAAETAVRKAEIDLEIERKKNQPKLEELQQAKEARSRLLLLFDSVMQELTSANLSEESESQRREYLLQLSAHIVKLKT